MRRLRLGLLALPLLVAPLAACGTGEETSAAEIVRSAASTTVDTETARMAMEMRMPGVPGMGNGTFTAEGVMDFADARGTMSFDLGAMLESAGQGVPEGMSTTVDMVFEGTTFWMRFPMMMASLGPEAAGKEWVKVDLSDVNQETGLDFSQLQQMGGNDPRNQLAYLTGVTDDVEEIGEEEIRGEPTTHYRAEITMEQVLDHLESEDAVVDREQFEQHMAQLGLEEMVIDVWIDDEGRARRMLQTIPAPAEAGGGEIEVIIDLYDFGTDVNVEIPPDELTVDMSELMRASTDSGTAVGG